MKLFVVAISTLAIIIAICVWGTVYGTGTIDEMISILSSSKDAKEVPEDAESMCAELQKRWEKHSFALSMLLPHHHLDKVKEKLVQLEAYAATDEFAEWHDAVLVLNEELLHIRGLVGISFDNIL